MSAHQQHYTSVLYCILYDITVSVWSITHCLSWVKQRLLVGFFAVRHQFSRLIQTLRHWYVQLADSTAQFVIFGDLSYIWSHLSLHPVVSYSLHESLDSISWTSCWITIAPKHGLVLLLPHDVVSSIVFDDDQFGLYWALKLSILPTDILSCLEAHEDCRYWLSGLHCVEDGVWSVACVEGGGHSVRVGRVIHSSVGVSIMAVIGGWIEKIKFFFLHTNVIPKRNKIGCSVAEQWLAGGQHFLVIWSGRKAAIGSASTYQTIAFVDATCRPIFLNTVSHLVWTVVTVALVIVVISQALVVSKVMTFPQIALVISLFLPSVMSFLGTKAMFCPWFSLPFLPRAQVFLQAVVSGEMVTAVTPRVSKVTPQCSVCFILVLVKTMLLPPALVLVVVWLVYLVGHCGAS